MEVWKAGIIKEHEENCDGGACGYYLDCGAYLLTYICYDNKTVFKKSLSIPENHC